jgi:hypothetical protein
MASARTPGTQCNDRNPANIHDGTLCRAPSPSAGPVNSGGPTPPARKLSAMLLDRVALTRFLRSVAYVQIAAETMRLENTAIGLWFSSAEVDTGNEKEKEKLVENRKIRLMEEFAKASSRGGNATLEFLVAQERSRDEAKLRIQDIFSAATKSNKETTKGLEHWVVGLKTVEYGAGIVITVTGLFVSAPAQLAAGVVGFSYDTATHVIDRYAKAGKMDAHLIAPVSTKIASEDTPQEVAKCILAGKELKDIEKLEQTVKHLHKKIATKQAMIQATSSRHNIARLTRSINKNEANLSSELRQIRRFRGVTYLFAAWDVFENGKRIWEAWHQD